MNTLLIMGCFSSKIIDETSENEFSNELSNTAQPSTPVPVPTRPTAVTLGTPTPRLTITTHPPNKPRNIFSSYRRARISILGDSP